MSEDNGEIETNGDTINKSNATSLEMTTTVVDDSSEKDSDNDTDYFGNNDVDSAVLEVINTFIIEQLQKEQLKQQEQQNSNNVNDDNDIDEEEYIEDYIQEYTSIRTNIIESMNESTNSSKIELQKEIQNDLINSCRYNEYIVICSIVSLYPKLIYYSDTISGNTSFHMACANGHTTIVVLLLSIERIMQLSSDTETKIEIETKSESVTTNENNNVNKSFCTMCNKNGNTPLHYAVSNKQLDIVRILVQQSNINVLQQNNFGRSILTEGFTISSTSTSSSTSSTTSPGNSNNTNNNNDKVIDDDHESENNGEQPEDDEEKQEQSVEPGETPKRDICTDILELLLQHDSASEEKLIATSSQSKATTTSQSNTTNTSVPNSKQQGISNDDSVSDTNDLKEQQKSNDNVSSVIHSFTFGRFDRPKCQDPKQQDNDNATKISTNNNKTISINVRELAIATNDNDSILGQCNPNNDTTGYGIWSSSIICSQWMIDIFLIQYNTIFSNTTGNSENNLIVLELGSGCGLPGLCVGATNIPSIVYVTDFNIQTVSNLQYNINMLLDDQNQKQTQKSDQQQQENNDTNTNKKVTKVIASTMNWSDQSTWPTTTTAIPNQQQEVNESSVSSSSYEQVDVIIGSDLIYQSDMVPLLVQTISLLLKSGGHFFYVAPAPAVAAATSPMTEESADCVTVPTGSRQGHDEFISVLLSLSIQQEEIEGEVQVNNNSTITNLNPSLSSSSSLFTLFSKQLAPKEYYNNPLTNNDNDLAFIHFSELYTTQYNLYHFQKN